MASLLASTCISLARVDKRVHILLFFLSQVKVTSSWGQDTGNRQVSMQVAAVLKAAFVELHPHRRGKQRKTGEKCP